MIEVKKRDRETTEGLIRRFTKRIQQSRVLAKARRTRYRTKDKTREQKRSDALYKVEIRKKIDTLKKMGKFNEETLKEVRRKMGV